MIYHEQIRKTRHISPETRSFAGYHPRISLSSVGNHSIQQGLPETKIAVQNGSKGLWMIIEMKS
jgi:hypothetical protein